MCVRTANLADISILKGTIGNSLFLAMTFEVCLMLRSMSLVLKQHHTMISWWESEITEGSKTQVVQFWRQQRHESLLKSLQKNSFLLHYYHQVTHYQRHGNERSEVSLSAHTLSPTFSKHPPLVTSGVWLQTQIYLVWLLVQAQGRGQEVTSSRLSSPSQQEHFTSPQQPYCTRELHWLCTRFKSVK